MAAAILADPQCEAVRALTGLGIDVAELRSSLKTGEPVVRADPVPADLQHSREALLGRRKYRPVPMGGLFLRLLLRVLPSRPGTTPGYWARLEAGEVAQAHGGPVRSDDLLLAILRTHALTGYYPHMVETQREDTRAGRFLTEAGLDYRKVRAAMDEHDLGRDAVALKKQLERAVSTTDLLRRLLDEPGNRAIRLLEVLDVDPVALRAQIA